MDKKLILMEQINKLLNGFSNFKEFNECYYRYFLKNVTSRDLTEDENDFFSDIQEEFDWTVENPSEEDRGYGYMDWKQFIEYVRQVTKIFLEKNRLGWQEAEEIKSRILKNP